jgi:hypothetical protein
MSDVQLSETEQKYFDTKGAEAPPPEPETKAPETGADEAPKAPPAPEVEQPQVEEDKDNPGKFVRLGALHEERERRKEIARALEQERVANAERNLVPEQPQQPVDPLDRIARVEQWAQQREQQERQAYEIEQQKQGFYKAVSQKEAEFSKEHPDYYEAVEYAKQARVQELQILGYADEQISNILINDLEMISGDALRRGKNPAETFYNFAKHRGFAGPKPVEKPAAAEKLSTIAAGQAAGKSLGSAAGTSPPALTLKTLAEMPDDEFAKISTDKKAWRKMMGG